ncbi:hypothetical protein BJ912DRAFT_922188 [Pholiota molesta]|nr:hypothetical protein BJ912DRAFT_922188 [Pholiota molesta]
MVTTVDGLHSHHHQPPPRRLAPPMQPRCCSNTRNDGTGEVDTKGRPMKWESCQYASVGQPSPPLSVSLCPALTLHGLATSRTPRLPRHDTTAACEHSPPITTRRRHARTRQSPPRSPPGPALALHTPVMDCTPAARHVFTTSRCDDAAGGFCGDDDASGQHDNTSRHHSRCNDAAGGVSVDDDASGQRQWTVYVGGGSGRIDGGGVHDNSGSIHNNGGGRRDDAVDTTLRQTR